MDKYRHTDNSQELDDVSRLILELKDLSGDSQESFDYLMPEPQEEEIPAVEELPFADEALAEPTKRFPLLRKKRIPEQDDTVLEEPDFPEERVPVRKRGLLPIWMVAIINILVGGVVIVTFALFHHVLPAMISARQWEEARLHATEAPTVSVQTPVDTPVETPVEGATEVPTEPDLRTEWQKKFAEHFSDEIIQTENSYKSPNISITVETVSYGEGKKKQTYHVADVYIGSIENFTTYVAGGNSGGYFTKQDVEEMSRDSNALLAICGDFITLQRGGFLMRNGNIFYETTNNDSICALFPDGTMETYEAREYSIDDIKNRGAIQVWSFGPTLLDENGEVRSRYDVPRAVSYPNPRSAIGYYEPGHYCFLVADGRQDGYAKGLTIPELAQIFKDLGCVRAYNLDGGGSAVMTFNQKMYSKQSNGGRELGDILLIRETPEFLATLPATVPAETVPAETAVPEAAEGTEMTETGEGIG